MGAAKVLGGFTTWIPISADEKKKVGQHMTIVRPRTLPQSAEVAKMGGESDDMWLEIQV